MNQGDVVLVVDADGIVTNAVVYGEGWSPDEGMTAVPVGTVPDGVWIGWRLAGGDWLPPPEG